MKLLRTFFILVALCVITTAVNAMGVMAPGTKYWEGFSNWWHNLWN